MTMPGAELKLVWAAYRLPKQGSADAECEDAYAGDPRAGRFAVADGASESAFARPWAESLAQGYVNHPGPWSGWLPAARAAWQGRFDGEDMPWYVEAKFQEGAFATLLGLTLGRRPGPGGRLSWRALAVGDSCLFQVRGDRVRRAFPVKRAADFGSRPALVASRPRPPQLPRCRRLLARGTWRIGDVFLLMTDALAQCFLAEVETGGRPWDRLTSVRCPAEFAALVDDLRATGRLRNDDTTLVRIQAESP
jgi:hypothetical protein